MFTINCCSQWLDEDEAEEEDVGEEGDEDEVDHEDDHQTLCLLLNIQLFVQEFCFYFLSSAKRKKKICDFSVCFSLMNFSFFCTLKVGGHIEFHSVQFFAFQNA